MALGVGLSMMASAQSDLAFRRVGVSWENGAPRISFLARDLVNDSARRKLESGLAQTIALRVFAYRGAEEEPLAMVPRTCRVVYDLWEETFRIEQLAGSRPRTVTVASLDDVVATCLAVRNLRVGTPTDYAETRGHEIWFAVLVELNPLSADTVRRIRRWLARPGGRIDDSAFFGSFVGLFVDRRIGEAERTVRFRSQRVEVPR